MDKQDIIDHAQKNKLRRALVVTALPLETKAVRAHLQEIGSVVGRGGNIYECGEFISSQGQWLVVVAESGAGNYPAQGVVTSVHRDFPDFFDVVILVGVAGSRKKEAPIGSVVASSCIYWPYGGKYAAEAGFTSRPRPMSIDKALLGIANKVQREEDWHLRVRPLLKRQPTPPEVYPQPFPPSAFVAPIASIEAVLADQTSELEKKIADHYGDTYAVEMEGYGAAQAADGESTPFIVVRGISDMCGADKDAAKDAINQPVAASHASAFAFEMLDTWGAFYADKRSLPDAGGNNPASSNRDSSGAPSARNDSTKLVLNFNKDEQLLDSQLHVQVLEVLRQLANDDGIILLDEARSPYEMVFGVSHGTVRELEEAKFQLKVAEIFGLRLSGYATDNSYEKVVSYESLIARASEDLLQWPQRLPSGQHFNRPELDQLLSTIQAGSDESNVTVLLGPPGSGKSALLAELGGRLGEEGIPFLAIKSDLLSPTVETEDQLFQALRLPDTVSNVLTAIAGFQPVALIIDQLDALAGYVDLRTGRLNVLLNLIKQLSGERNVHIILSSRTFEFEHDSRLKTIRAESISLALPPWSSVLQVLESQGVQAANWPSDAQELLRTPQSLSTFLKLQDANQQPIATYQKLLDQLWSEILRKDDGPRMSKVLGLLAETMAEKETLWLGISKFEEYTPEILELISLGLLTDFDQSFRRIGFSHQTVFEHALARSFSQSEGRLSAFVKERQSSLFIRPKLWATLTYLRDLEPGTYDVELKALWGIEDLRPHLRILLIEFMGMQGAPSVSEVALMNEALASSNRLLALRAIIGSAGWFDAFRHTHIAKAMGNKNEAGLAAYILDKAWAFAPEAVIGNLIKYWSAEKTFDDYAWEVLQGNQKWDEQSINLAKEILKRTNLVQFIFDRFISIVGVDNPPVALQLVRARLDQQLQDAIRESDTRTKIRNVLEQRQGWDGLEALAKGQPKLFLDLLWPWFLQALSNLKRVSGDDSDRPGFPLRYGIDFRFPEENPFDLGEIVLIDAFVTAVETFAQSDRAGFLDWVSLNKNEQLMPVQRLIMHAMATQPEKYAEAIVALLMENPNRLHLGSLDDGVGTTRRVLQECREQIPDELLHQLEDSILEYSPSVPSDLDVQDRKYFNDMIRRVKLRLLDALSNERTSKKARKHITEERRRFPEDKDGRTIFGPKFIGSPIASQSLAKASDEDILNAFRQLPDATGWDNPKDWGKGGNIQLSREFAEFAKVNSERAITIIKKFEPAFGTRAAGYAISAMADAIEPHSLVELVLQLDQAGFSGDEFRSGVARAIERLVDRDAPIDDRVLKLLQSWLIQPKNSPAPEPIETEVDEDMPGTSDEPTDTSNELVSVLWHHGGLRALPSGNFPVLEAITRILLQRQSYDQLLSIYQQHLLTDESFKVWEALVPFIRFIRPDNTEQLQKFVEDLYKKHPDLLETYESAVMIAYLQWRLPDTAHNLLLEFTKSPKNRVQLAYGELVGLIALAQPGLKWAAKLLAEIVNSPERRAARIGITYSAAHLWKEAEKRPQALVVLKAIIPQADAPAWAAIFDIFRVADEITPEPEWISLLETIEASVQQADKVDPSFIIDRLQTLLPHKALLIGQLIRKLINKWKSEQDGFNKIAASAQELVDVAITLHRLGAETRELGTTIFEELLTVNTHAARETLNQIDNRFDAGALRQRLRLPRRSRQRRKAK